MNRIEQDVAALRATAARVCLWLALLAAIVTLAACGGGASSSAHRGASVASAASAKSCAAPATSLALASVTFGPGAVTYRSHILPIVRVHCASCHNPGGEASDVVLDAFASVSAEAFSVARQMVKDVQTRRMPLREIGVRMDQSSRDAFAQWAALGFPEGESDGTATAPVVQQPARVSYSATLQSIVQQRCVTCHAKGQQAPDLGDPEAIAADRGVLAAKMVKRVVSGDMPRPDPLPAAQVALFATWRDLGFPMRPDAAPLVSGATSAAPGGSADATAGAAISGGSACDAVAAP
jgi:mono/diheme cytochrome c family protein